MTTDPATVTPKIDTHELESAILAALPGIVANLGLVTSEKLTAEIDRLVTAQKTEIGHIREDVQAVSRRVDQVEQKNDTLQKQVEQFVTMGNQLITSLRGVQTTLLEVTKQIQANSAGVAQNREALSDLVRDVHGDEKKPLNGSIKADIAALRKDLLAIPGMVKGAVDTALAPVVEEQKSLKQTVADLVTFVTRRRGIERFVINRWRAILAGLVWGGIALAELQRSAGIDVIGFVGKLMGGMK